MLKRRNSPTDLEKQKKHAWSRVVGSHTIDPEALTDFEDSLFRVCLAAYANTRRGNNVLKNLKLQRCNAKQYIVASFRCSVWC